MDKLNYLHHRASTTEVADISGNISAAITKFSIEDDFLNNRSSKLSLLSLKMHDRIGVLRNKELSGEIDLTDDDRDNLTVVLIQFVKAYHRWNNPDTKDAADRILQIIKAHGGNHTKQGYEKQSALLDSLLSELEKPENKEAISKLNLTLLVEELKQLQEKFTNLYRQSAELEAAKPQGISPTELRKETRGLINSLVDFLNVMNMANAEKYGTLFTEFAELINTLNTKIKSRT